MLTCELIETADDDAGIGAVVDEDGRGSHPLLEVVKAEWDVLSVAPIEHPNFPVG